MTAKEKNLELYVQQFVDFLDNEDEQEFQLEFCQDIPVAPPIINEDALPATTDRKALLVRKARECRDNSRLMYMCRKYPDSGIEPLPVSWYLGAMQEHTDDCNRAYIDDFTKECTLTDWTIENG